MNKIVIAVTAVSMLLSIAQAKVSEGEHKADASHEKHWDYDKNGPANWGEFSETCSKGKAQSPINILSGESITIDPKDIIQLNHDTTITASVVDNGHAIQVTPEKGAHVLFRGEPYQLLQFHFHGLSEHTVDGKQYDMVAHYVHQNLNTKELLVVAVLFEEGKNNPLLDTIINNIGKKITINPSDLAPTEKKDFYHYVGSLTTPPCSEGVQWFVLKNPSSASKEQIAAFRKYYHENDRPVQELNDRVIKGN